MVVKKVAAWNGVDMGDVVLVVDGVDAFRKKQENRGLGQQLGKVLAPSQWRNFVILAFITGVWQSTITSVPPPLLPLMHWTLVA